VTAKLGRSQLDDLQRRLDGVGDLACGTARRPDLARQTFGAADQAQPQAARSECGSNFCREPLSFVRFIKDMKATAVEHELKWTAARTISEKIQSSEAAGQSASRHFGLGSFDSERRNIDPLYVETMFGQPNCVRAGTGADFKRRGWFDPA
jgi:hypothetical protein